MGFNWPNHIPAIGRTTTFLLEELPPWHSNRLSRLIKTPKLHVGDTGLACALLGLDAAEVDIVLERGAAQVAGVEAKASATVTAADFRGLRKLKDAAGKRFASGVVLYDGETSAGFGDGLSAVPIRALWETT